MFVHAILDLSKKDWVESAKEGGLGTWLSGIEILHCDAATTKEAFADFLTQKMVPPCTIHWECRSSGNAGDHTELTGKCILYFELRYLAAVSVSILQGAEFMGKSITITDMKPVAAPEYQPADAPLIFVSENGKIEVVEQYSYGSDPSSFGRLAGDPDTKTIYAMSLTNRI